jgi:hypothetical protein
MNIGLNIFRGAGSFLKFIVVQLVKKFSSFKEPEISLLHLPKTSFKLYAEPFQSNPQPYILFLYDPS